MFFGTVPVDLPHPVFQLRQRKVLLLCGPLLTPFELGRPVSIDKNAKRMQMGQHRVRAAPDNHAVTPLRQLFNDLLLGNGH